MASRAPASLIMRTIFFDVCRAPANRRSGMIALPSIAAAVLAECCMRRRFGTLWGRRLDEGAADIVIADDTRFRNGTPECWL